MFIVKHKAFFLGVAAIIIVVALGSIITFGMRSGIEFTGGTLIELSHGVDSQTVDRTAIETALDPLTLGAYSLRASDVVGSVDTGTGYLLRTRPVTIEERGVLVQALTDTGVSIDRFDEVGPTIGVELKHKAIVALTLIVLMIALYVAFVFRSVSKPVSSWVYGFITILILGHDVLVPAGVFAYLGHAFGAEVDVLFVTALLVVLGYSVNDTIVVFDRIRERLRVNGQINRREEFDVTVGTALSETYARSINTSFTTLLVLVALYYFGGTATTYFALMLIAGVVAGTYSSIFIAAPLLVAINEWRNK